MKAMVLNAIVSLDQVSEPLTMTELPVPVAGPGELLLAVSACGVCHTELDEIEGRTAPPVLPIIPGHEVIGRVAALGPGCCEHELGDRVGVGWIHSSTGGVDENVSDQFVATGRDVNGGYAEYMTVPEAYAVPIPEHLEDIQAAPLLCAGAIGYRALKLQVGRLTVDAAVDQLAQVRDTLGSEIELMADAFMQWDLETALGVVKQVEKYNLGWLEEPPRGVV